MVSVCTVQCAPNVWEHSTTAFFKYCLPTLLAFVIFVFFIFVMQIYLTVSTVQYSIM